MSFSSMLLTPHEDTGLEAADKPVSGSVAPNVHYQCGMTQLMLREDASRRRRRANILVVADEPALALSIVAGLEQRGHRAVWAMALSAVASAITERPRLILLDMDLPDNGAREILGFLKGDPRTAAIPILALS